MGGSESKPVSDGTQVYIITKMSAALNSASVLGVFLEKEARKGVNNRRNGLIFAHL